MMVDNDPHSARDLSHFADNLLQQVHDNFQALADKLALRNMGDHIDDLEKHVNGLLTQAGVENSSEELTSATGGRQSYLHTQFSYSRKSYEDLQSLFLH